MKHVMFICGTNSIYSQIAAGFAKHLGVGTIRVTSAGLAASAVAPAAINTMNDLGVDISRQTSQILSQCNPEDFDIVISLGRDLNLSPEWRERERFEEWPLADLIERPERLPKVRDEIRERVTNLIESLHQPH